MPITLAQAQVNAANDIDYNVIDMLRRYSWLWDQLVWDDTVTPATNGGSLTYGYVRLSTAAPAAFRAINSEYTPGQATRAQVTVNLKPMGGLFNVDRVLRNLGPQQSNEVTFQLQQLAVSATTRMQQELILGDTAVDANGFDGLSKTLTGTSTEVTATNADWRPATIVTQALAMAALDSFDLFLAKIFASRVGGGASNAPGELPPGVKAIMSNTVGVTRLAALARWAGIFTESKDDVGRQVNRYRDWVLVDIGDRPDGSVPIIPINGSGQTDYYAATFGLDAVHGAALANTPLVSTWLPDFSTAGAVKSGELEIGPGALCVRSTRSAGVYRTVTVQ